MLYFYIIGCIISLIIGIIEIIKDKPKEDDMREYGVISIMVIMSWITVFIYFIRIKTINKVIKRLFKY